MAAAPEPRDGPQQGALPSARGALDEQRLPWKLTEEVGSELGSEFAGGSLFAGTLVRVGLKGNPQETAPGGGPPCLKQPETGNDHWF